MCVISCSIFYLLTFYFSVSSCVKLKCVSCWQRILWSCSFSISPAISGFEFDSSGLVQLLINVDFHLLQWCWIYIVTSVLCFFLFLLLCLFWCELTIFRCLFLFFVLVIVISNVSLHYFLVLDLEIIICISNTSTIGN